MASAGSSNKPMSKFFGGAGDQSFGTAGELSKLQVDAMRVDALKDPTTRLARNAATEGGFTKSFLNRSAIVGYNNVYSNKISTEGKVTAQKASGRCWMFACLNTMRIELMRKFNLSDSFELSQSYLFFYDKLERSNFFLESIIQTSDQPLEGRLVSHLLSNATVLNDGGQWDMLVNLVNKYGVVPKSVYPESHAATASRPMNLFLRGKLRGFARTLRSLRTEADMRAAKKKMMGVIYAALVVFLGEPPVSFYWSYMGGSGACAGGDKEKKTPQRQGPFTPSDFYRKVVPFVMDAKISLINDPRNPFYKMYSVDYLGNVVGGKAVRYLNLPIADLKKYAAKTIDQDLPVWFGCDVGKDKDNEYGVMDTLLRDTDGAMPGFAKIGRGLKKAERLQYGHSLMTHAMVFTAYDTKVAGGSGGSGISKWRVENSWGEARGDKGYFLMTDQWFDEYMYQVVVDKSILDKNALDIISGATKPVVLPAWDPMGSLARLNPTTSV